MTATKTASATLPSGEELEAAWNTVVNAVDELEGVTFRVHHFIDDAMHRDGARPTEPVTYEQIGALVEWTDELARTLQHAAKEVLVVQEATRKDLTSIRAHGSVCSIPQFNRHGSPNYIRNTEGSLVFVGDPGEAV